jgi:hypothetical protein
MSESKQKLCPILKAYCKLDGCAWYIGAGTQCCAVKEMGRQAWRKRE